MGEALHRQTEGASSSQALVLMGGFNHCGRDSTAGQNPQGSSLVSTAISVKKIQFFYKQLKSQQEGAVLDLVLTKRQDLVGNAVLQGSLGYSDHNMGAIQEPQASEDGTQQAHFPARLWPVQGPAENSPMG